MKVTEECWCQVIHFTLLYRPLQYNFVLSAVYGNHTSSLRRSLWASLCTFSEESDLPWVLGGNFNTFRSISDHEGRSQPSLTALHDFNDCIESCGLMTPQFHGSKFTWTDGRGLGRVCRRLDWLFLNTAFHDKFDDLQLTHLPRIASDHTPLLLLCRISPPPTRRSFQFLDSWLLHPDFHNYMQAAWTSYPTTGGMYCFYSKLFKLKKDVQRWNKEIFGNIFSNVQQAEINLTRAENLWDTNPTDETRTEYHRAKVEYLQASSYELHFWKQKACVRWLKEGDANTRHFHSIVKGKRLNLRIQQIRSSAGVVCTAPDDIMAEAVSFYKSLFAREPTNNYDDILRHILTLVSSEDHAYLTHIPFPEEVKSAVWNLDPHSAAGPDGFNGNFYRSCWSIIQTDVIKAVHEFFLGVPQPTVMANALITLIPKKHSPATFSDFCPICLTNFLSKVCTRIVASRLSTLLPRLISPEQTGFLPGTDFLPKYYWLVR